MILHECIRCGREFKSADALILHWEKAHPTPTPTPTLEQFLSRAASDCVNGR